MTETLNKKTYLLICEIGPIWDFTRHSRKTVDFWSASFLFSYFMSEVARDIKNNGGDIFLPYLDNNPMFSGKGTVTAGSIPDQIYAIFKNIDKAKKDDIKTKLKIVVEKTVKKIGEEIQKELPSGVTIDYSEINNFFNFFFIFHEIQNNTPIFDEFIEAEQKIKMRASLRPFAQSTPPHLTSPQGGEGQGEGKFYINKWDKCSLCGDRKKIHDMPPDKEAETHYQKEHICCVCLLKRYLPKVVERIIPNIDKKPRYQSTSDIAAIPIENYCIKLKDYTDCKDEILETLSAYESLSKEFKEQAGENTGGEGRRFFEPLSKEFRDKFKELEKKLIKKDKTYVPLKWLDRSFYAIVYMDGDNLGEILKGKKDEFSLYIDKVSSLIAEFSNNVNSIVSKYYGQLIFAGGEDVNFIIHPEYLLDCIEELSNYYNGLFANDTLTKDMKDKFTLSAGAVICYHKYPLSRVILGAGEILKDKAKSYKDINNGDKNATAISLIKGHTETFNFTFSNKLIGDLKRLKELLLSADVSRTTPYRIKESEEILKAITDDKHKINYLYTIIAGTRGIEKTNAEIMKIVGLLMKFESIDTMINALLYARFLAGDK